MYCDPVGPAFTQTVCEQFSILGKSITPQRHVAFLRECIWIQKYLCFTIKSCLAVQNARMKNFTCILKFFNGISIEAHT